MKRTQTIPEEVAKIIKEKILIEGEYKPNQQIPNEIELAKLLGVSRNSIREAEKMLAAANILRIERGRGTFVTDNPNNTADVFGISSVQNKRRLLLDWFQTREVLEPLCARCAAENGTKEEKKQIREMEQRCAEKIVNGHDFSKEDADYHRAIAIASHNLVVESFLPMMITAVSDSVKVNYLADSKTTVGNALYFHDKIAKYIESNRADAAASMMETHIRIGLEQILRGMR